MVASYAWTVANATRLFPDILQDDDLEYRYILMSSRIEIILMPVDAILPNSQMFIPTRFCARQDQLLRSRIEICTYLLLRFSERQLAQRTP